jgi:hypothetical protein
VTIRVRNWPGVPAGDFAIEDRLHLFWATQVEVLADHVLEEQAPVHRPVEHLGQGELGLQDRDVIAIAGLAIGPGEGVWQQTQPLAQQGVDLLCREAIADLLQPRGIGAAQDPIVERREGDAFARQLPLGVFVPIQVQLGIERKVAAELEEERAEVAIHRVDVIVVDHCARAHDPGIGLTGLRVPALLGAEYRRLFLRLADEHNPFVFVERTQMLGHHGVFALPLVELHERHPLLGRKSFQRRDEAPADRAHQCPRWQRLAAMIAEKPHNSLLRLQPRHIDVEVHAVDPLDGKLHMMGKDFGHALWYHPSGSGRSVMPLAGVLTRAVQLSLVYQSSS